MVLWSTDDRAEGKENIPQISILVLWDDEPTSCWWVLWKLPRFATLTIHHGGLKGQADYGVRIGLRRPSQPKGELEETEPLWVGTKSEFCTAPCKRRWKCVHRVQPWEQQEYKTQEENKTWMMQGRKMCFWVEVISSMSDICHMIVQNSLNITTELDESFISEEEFPRISGKGNCVIWQESMKLISIARY